MQRVWLIVAGLSGAAAVVLGSVGSHGIPFEEGGRATWLVAERYHFLHTLALLLTALLPLGRSRWLRLAAWGFALGTLLFCVPVYLKAAGQGSALTSLAPVGGTLLIVAWLCLAIGGLRADVFTQRRDAAS